MPPVLTESPVYMTLTDEIKTLNDAHIINTYGERSVALTRGEGMRLWDAEGREYLDFFAGIAVCNLGHCHPAVTKAICDQAQKLVHVSNLYYIEAQTLLAASLCRHSFAEKWFFCNGGAEANEAAIKLARRYWEKQGTPKPGIITANQSFHGRTIATVTATGQPKYHDGFQPLVPGFSHVPYGKLDTLEAALSEDTGAVLLEVVQGEGGVRPGTREYLQGAQALCRERGAFLILDEVQTGIGRTGRTFAYQHFGLQPDLVCLAKSLAAGVAMGAVLIGERLGAIPGRVHGSTFGGNPLASAAANAVLDVLEEEQLCERAARLGASLQEKLRALDSPHVREVRGLGLMVGVELKQKVGPLVTALKGRGVLALGAGATVLRLLPPLVISEADLDTVVAAIGAALSELN